MAANAKETLPVDELEDILCLIEEGSLEDDDELNEIEDLMMEGASDEANHADFKCSDFEKMCKSRRGQTRHSTSQHGDISSSGLIVSPLTASKIPSSSSSSSGNFIHQKLHPLQLKSIVLECAENVSMDECFPSRLREKFSKGSFIFTNYDAFELWSRLKNVVDDFSGDAEKFFSSFFHCWLSMFCPRSLMIPL